MIDAVEIALKNAYWSSRANCRVMAFAAYEALGLPVDGDRLPALWRIIDGWCRNPFGLRFDAMAREVVAALERAREAV
jgi:hypothetical protein